jgi:hypothetical protein
MVRIRRPPQFDPIAFSKTSFILRELAPSSLLTSSAQPATAVQQTRCPTCGTDLLGKFCHHCGEKRHHEEELALKHFALHALHELTHLDSKVFATVRYLFSRPGYLTQEYVAGRRSLYMKPLSLFLVVCALYFLVDSYFPRSVYDVYWLTQQDKTGNVDKLWTKLAAKKHVSKEMIMDRTQVRVHRVSTAMQFANVLVAAVVLALLYHKRFFVERLVFAFHFLSFVFLTSSLLHPLTFRLDIYTWASYLISGATLLVYFVYLFLALRRVYQQSAGLTLIKSLVTLAATWLALIVTQIVALVIGVVSAARS